MKLRWTIVTLAQLAALILTLVVGAFAGPEEPHW